MFVKFWKGLTTRWQNLLQTNQIIAWNYCNKNVRYTQCKQQYTDRKQIPLPLWMLSHCFFMNINTYMHTSTNKYTYIHAHIYKHTKQTHAHSVRLFFCSSGCLTLQFEKSARCCFITSHLLKVLNIKYDKQLFQTWKEYGYSVGAPE